MTTSNSTANLSNTTTNTSAINTSAINTSDSNNSTPKPAHIYVTQHFLNGNRSVSKLNHHQLPELENHPRRRRVCISWETTPRLILITASVQSPRAMAAFPNLLAFLQSLPNVTVGVEANLAQFSHHSVPVIQPCETPIPSLDKDMKLLTLNPTSRPTFSSDHVDLVLCLGGDGLIFHVLSNYFPTRVPPFVPFNMGSMGFLTPFNFENHASDIRAILEGHNNTVTMRMRLKCVIIRGANGATSPIHNFEHNMLDETRQCQQQQVFHVLNELVIDRGPAPYLSNLEVLCDDCAVTRVQADGLIVATPTGSTAYSLSSGGSMVHPGVPAILFTPICPHSLSFRPVLFPDHVTLQIKVPRDARASAWVSFDGRHRMELMRGDKVVVSVSEWSVPTFTKLDTTNDWFVSVRKCLRWNERVIQGSHSDE